MFRRSVREEGKVRLGCGLQINQRDREQRVWETFARQGCSCDNGGKTESRPRQTQFSLRRTVHPINRDQLRDRSLDLPHRSSAEHTRDLRWSLRSRRAQLTSHPYVVVELLPPLESAHVVHIVRNGHRNSPAARLEHPATNDIDVVG